MTELYRRKQQQIDEKAARQEAKQNKVKNLLINSDLAIWQRGTSFNLNTTSFIYTADRFRL